MMLSTRIGSGSFGTVYKGKWHGKFGAFTSRLGEVKFQSREGQDGDKIEFCSSQPSPGIPDYV